MRSTVFHIRWLKTPLMTKNYISLVRQYMVEDTMIRQAVADACGDSVESGVVFELLLERVMHKGRAHGRAIYTTWKASHQQQ